jgi:hypothetical protein
LPPPLPAPTVALLSAGAIATVAAATTAALVPSAAIAPTAAYFAAAGSAASMFSPPLPLFPLPLHPTVYVSIAATPPILFSTPSPP